MRRSRVSRPRRLHVRIGTTFSGILCFVLVVAGLSAPAVASERAQSDDTDAQAEQAVKDAQARADRAASAYFDALEHSQEIDRDIEELRAQLEQLDGEVARLRKVTVARAVEAYKRAGTPFANAFGDNAAVRESTRRTVLLGVVNARDREAADEFRRLRDDRSLRQDELAAAKAEAAAGVDDLEAEERRVNSLLVKAQNERRALADERAVATAGAAVPAGSEPAGTSAAGSAPADGTPTSSAPTGTTKPAGSSAAPTPAPAPADYVPRTGAHPHHDDPFLACTRQRESGGNYQAFNPAGPYLGAYQFSQSTWNSSANHAGRGDLVGLDPRRASVYDQDDMAWTLYQWRGKGPWNGLC